MIDEKYTDYANKVLNGEILACKYIQLACKRYLSWFEREDIEFRAEKVDKVINFCQHLKHFTGRFNNQNFILQPFQKWIIYNIYGFYYKGTEERVIKNVWIELARKNGKALAIDTPIPTPTGYTTMGDLNVGDYVISDTGQPTQVTYVTPTMYDHKCYEVTFSDGEVITCDADHNWYVDRYHKRKYHVETTQEIIDKGYWNYRKDGYKDCYVSIPTAQPIQYEEQKLPIDPYTFGVWLGDGHKSAPKLTLNGDDCMEILSYIPYKPRTIQKYKDENAYEVSLTNGRGEKLSDFSKFLSDYKIKGNKYIPKEFLYNSVENRLALLQGIMDTDGYIHINHNNGSVMCEIQQKNNDISDGICFLLNSFGVKYNRRKKIPKINGKEYDEVNRISFNVDKSTPVFRLKRKYNLLKDEKGKKNVKHITSIKEVESVPVKCITVDSPSHLYLCGKKNTVTHNTFFAAALGLYALIGDGENNSEVELIANSRKQAQICFDMCSNMVTKLDAKHKHFKPYRDKIKFDYTKSFLQVLSSDSGSNDGWNSYCFIADEVHAYPDSKMFDVMKSSQGMRDNPLAIAITTAGFNLFSFAYKQRKTNIEVLYGNLEDDSQFSAIFTLDEEDDFRDESVWIKANPNLGVTVKPQYLKEQVQQAKNNPSLEISTRTKNFNQWLATSDIWINNELLLEYSKKVDLNDYKDKEIYGYMGVDLSAVSDLTCVSLLLPYDGKFIYKNYYYLPETCLHDNSNADLYRQWYNRGLITITQGNVVDYDFIIKDIMKINEDIPLQLIGYDKWNSTQFAIQMTELGMPIQPYSQAIANFSMPTKTLERLIKKGDVVIDDNEITRYCFSNVVLKHDWNDNVKPIKEENQQKIDGVIAMIQAMGTYLSVEHYNNEIFGFNVE